MAKKSKQLRAALEKIDSTKAYSVEEAVALAKETNFAKFDATVEVAYNLNIDVKKADQQIRGAMVLPNGTGKTARVLVFARGAKAEEAKAAGADFVGEDDLVAKINDGWLDFDVVIATPDMMALVGRLGRVLGPRNLMPNPKTGTVTMDVAKAVEESKGGKITYRADKAGIVQAIIGKVSFDDTKLVEMEIRDLLSEYDFPGDDLPVIQGSALKALEGDTKYEDIVMELMNTVDEYIPEPERDTDKPLLLPVEDVFSITGRGTVASGRIDRGVVRVNDEVEIVGLKEEIQKAVVTGVEMFRKQLDEGIAGDNVGVLLRGIQRDEIERGQVLAAPGSINPHTKFKGEVYILSKEEGGRHTPFFNNYRPQFYFRTTDVTGSIELPAGTEMVMPGDNVTIDVELIHPIAVEQGTTFSIREGGRTVGSGIVSEIEA